MIETLLLAELKKFVQEVLKDFMLPVKGGGFRPVVAVSGYLPPKRSTSVDDFPFVIVRADSGSASRGNATVQVSLIIGCYSDESDGYAWCIEAMTRLRNALLIQTVLTNRFVLQTPVTWANHEDQPYPQWLLSMTTKWSFEAPEAFE